MNQPPVSMEEVEAWNLPHTFSRPPGEIVFTYGLLVAELPQIRTEDGRAALATRWGFDEVNHLQGQLMAPLRIPVPPELEEAAQGVVDVTVLTRVERFTRALAVAADENDRVPEGFEDELRWFLNEVRRPDRLTWNLRVAGDELVRVRAPAYEDLRERLAIEFDHLVTQRPLLRRCKLCRRPFVPLRSSRPEVHCRTHLWRWDRGSQPTHIESCMPIDDETERARTAKRLHQRFRRAKQRYGPSSKKTKDALRAWNEWMLANPPVRTRGRPPQPDTTYQPGGENDGQ